MDQVLNELSSLCLDTVDEDWVRAIYHSEFLEIVDLPADYEAALESVAVPKVFQNLMKSITTWLSPESDEEEDKSWAALSPKVNHQKLLTVLAYYIDDGTKNVHTKEYRNNALLASRVYYTLLSIPGYKAYHIYHAQLFTHSLGCLSFPREMCEKDDNYYSTKELTREVNSVIRELRPYVLDLRSVVEKLHLKPTDMNFEDILSNLVDITGGAIVNKLNIDKIELGNISRVIYAMIDTLLQEPGGKPSSVAIQLLFKCLLPKLVAASVDSRNANNLVRASYVTYSGLLLTRYGKAAVSGFTVLLQHLCYTQDGLERAEVRAARVQLVVGLMSLLPRRAHRATVRWLLQLTTSAKVSHRHIAMELLANLLSHDPEEEGSEQPEDDNPPPSASEAPQEAKQSDAETANTDLEKTAEGQASIETTDTESSQELPDVDPAKEMMELGAAEDEVAGMLRARAHTVAHAKLLAALAARVEDASGTLRARALAILSDVTAASSPAVQVALKKVNAGGEVSRLVAIAAQCAGDERAAVRRAALHLMHRCIATDAESLTDTNLAVLTSLCRDASIIVRSAAIAALGELAASTGVTDAVGAGERVVDAFLAGPMHQLSDPETKVQEQLVTLLQQILIGRLRPRRKGKQASRDEDPLPWVFLAAVARHNMRRHLQKACALMAKSTSCISDRLVDILSTHLCTPSKDKAKDDARKKDTPQEDAPQKDTPQDDTAQKDKPQAVTSEKDTQQAEASEKDPPEADTSEKDTQEAATCEKDTPQADMPRKDKPQSDTCEKDTQQADTSEKDKPQAAISQNDKPQDDTTQERELQALLLLSCVARHVDYGEPGFVLDYYYRLMDEDQEQDARLLPLTLEVLTTWSRFLAAEARGALRKHLICALGAPGPAADGCRTTCAALAAHLDPSNLQWATELMQIYEKRSLGGGGVQDWLTAADLSLVAPVPPSPALLRLFLNALENPPADTDTESRGCTVAGLGRLCIRSRDAAAAAAPPLARLLFTPAEPMAARVNSLLALIDICTRYTCIVEPLLGSVCGCFNIDAPSPLRRAAASGLTRLLLGGFLRLRTPLYYRYCALLADEDPDVREPAEYYVTCCLTVDVIYHHFVDCVIHYNNGDTESISFDARQLIYDVMLQRMSLVQKLNIQCRLAREVLEHAADVCDEAEADAELPASLDAALLDTITLLCGPRMKLPRKPQNAGEGNDIDNLHERVTTNIVSHKMKRTVAEVLVPAVLRLSARMRNRGGQLNVYLVRIATDLLKDYRQEIEELIENDEELVARVRQFQETIGEEPSFGNTRNLVTSSTAHEPDTPRAARRRPAARTPRRGPTAKRLLRV